MTDGAGRSGKVEDVSNPEQLTGTLLGGRYRVGKLLGSGGMGAVYDGVQEGINRKVALKVLHAHLAGDAELLARFEREARAVATLGHPNVVQINDFQTNPGEPPFIVMELLQGESLRDLLKRSPRLPPERVAYIAMQMLSALGAAHKASIVHRDVKPDNVFLSRTSVQADIVKVLDFGVAKLLGGEDKDKLTRSGFVVGTLSYMAPEQACGDPVDGRADLYSVGACMYFALAGRKPFDQPTTPALLKAILTEKPVPLAVVRQDIDTGLAAIVDRALSKPPQERFTSPEEMAEALAPFARPTSLEGAPTASAAPTRPAPHAGGTPTAATAAQRPAPPRPATAATAARTPMARPPTGATITDRVSAAPEGQRMPMQDATMRSPTAAVPSQPTAPVATAPVVAPAVAQATEQQPAAPVMPQRTVAMAVSPPAPQAAAPVTAPVSIRTAPLPADTPPPSMPYPPAAAAQSPLPVVQRALPPPARKRSPLLWVLVALGALGLAGTAAAFLGLRYLGHGGAPAAGPETIAAATGTSTTTTATASTPAQGATADEAPLGSAAAVATTTAEAATHAAANPPPPASKTTSATTTKPTAATTTVTPAAVASTVVAALSAATATAPAATANAPGKPPKKKDKGPRTAAHLH